MDPINKNNRNKYALITGATSGIGYELAKLFAQDGYNLVLVARNETRLQEITGEFNDRYRVEVTPLAKDLFNPIAAKEIYEATEQMGIQVDVLVNDAGQGEWGPFAETTLERDLDIVQLNIVSVLSLTKYFLKDMLQRNEGKILQLGSEAGTAPGPLLAVYSATKAFIISFSVALANELKDTNITITVLLPGATDTDFFQKAHMEHSKAWREGKLAPPEDVAMDGYEALMKGENKIISGAKTKMHVFMNDLLGMETGAANVRKQMEPSQQEKGREHTGHQPSRKEREYIDANERKGRKQ